MLTDGDSIRHSAICGSYGRLENATVHHSNQRIDRASLFATRRSCEPRRNASTKYIESIAKIDHLVCHLLEHTSLERWEVGRMLKP
jgi:hypothetical protein